MGGSGLIMRVPISSTDVTFGQLHEQNPFFLSFLAFTPFVVRFAYASKTHHQRRFLHALVCLWVVVGGLAACLEHYWSISCPVSMTRFIETTNIFEHNLMWLAASQWASRAFVAEGTMLAVARERESLNIWDQDSDIFVVVDAKDEPAVLGILAEMKRNLETKYDEASVPVTVKISADRWLVQVYGVSKGHGDVWLWQQGTRKGESVIYNPDFTYGGLTKPTGGHRHSRDTALPTRTITWKGGANGKQLTLPVANAYHEMLVNQYGKDYMTPYMNRLQCTENMFSKLWPDPLALKYGFFLGILLLSLVVTAPQAGRYTPSTIVRTMARANGRRGAMA